MSEYFDQTHEILRESARKFVEREILPFVDAWEKAEEFPRELYRKTAEAGFLGIGYPEEYGGTRGDAFHGIVFAEEMSRCGSMGLVAGLQTHSISLPLILILGTEEQKRRFAPPVLAGQKIAALAVTEPGAGSDVASLRTRAVRDGNHYVVNGAKAFISSGCRADLLVTAVRTGGPGHAGVSLLVVESDSPGFRVAKKMEKMGWCASDTAELSFEDCRVPVENLLGEEGAGFTGLMLNFQKERLLLAVLGHAFAHVAYERAFRYAHEREAFGRMLSGFQTMRHKLVDMAAAVDVARQYNYHVASMVERGGNALREVAFAKILSSETAERVCREAIQILGGYGYTREYVLERIYRDVRVLAIGGGTTEIMKELAWKLLDS